MLNNFVIIFENSRKRLYVVCPSPLFLSQLIESPIMNAKIIAEVTSNIGATGMSK